MSNNISADCNVLCGKTPYHTYQNQNGILRFLGDDSKPLNNNPNYPPQPYAMNSVQDKEIKLPLYSLLVGFKVCRIYGTGGSSNGLDPLYSKFVSVLGDGASFGIYIDGGIFNNNFNTYETLMYSQGDVVTSYEKVINFYNKLFTSCEGFKLISSTNSTTEPDMNIVAQIAQQGGRYINIRPESNFATNYPDGANVWPIILDFSWLYSDNIDSRA